MRKAAERSLWAMTLLLMVLSGVVAQTPSFNCSRLPDFDDKVISMYSRGMSTREIQGYLEEIYGAEVSADLIRTVTDAVSAEVAAWQSRPLETLYPVMFFDAIRAKVRDQGTVSNKAAYLALGITSDKCGTTG